MVAPPAAPAASGCPPSQSRAWCTPAKPPGCWPRSPVPRRPKEGAGPQAGKHCRRYRFPSALESFCFHWGACGGRTSKRFNWWVRPQERKDKKTKLTTFKTILLCSRRTEHRFMLWAAVTFYDWAPEGFSAFWENFQLQGGGRMRMHVSSVISKTIPPCFLSATSPGLSSRLRNLHFCQRDSRESACSAESSPETCYRVERNLSPSCGCVLTAGGRRVPG